MIDLRLYQTLLAALVDVILQLQTKESIKLLKDKDLRVIVLTSSIIMKIFVSTHQKRRKLIMIFMILLGSKQLLIWKKFPLQSDE
jgi:hypothetical protein